MLIQAGTQAATPITASVSALARRLRTDALRGGGYDWHDDEIGRFGSIHYVDETAVIASYHLLGVMARSRGRYRVAQVAFHLAEHALWMSARIGRHKPEPRLPADWRREFIRIVRQRYQYEAIEPGELYARPDGMGARVHRRSLAHGR